MDMTRREFTLALAAAASLRPSLFVFVIASLGRIAVFEICPQDKAFPSCHRILMKGL